ncbi:MAG: trxA [Clostridiales bacterium]|jgi:thioredoxin 1|nr:trxA [Clostridiales bacterium]
MIIHVTDSTFDEKVLNSEKPVFVDFWATWCGPCKMLTPVIEKVAQNLENQIDIAKVDIDENPQISSMYGITSVPTMILFHKGKPVGKLVGFRPADQIESAIKGALSL